MAEAIKYLVSKKMAGKERALEALLDYLVNNISPSEASQKHSVSKYVIKGAAIELRRRAGGYGSAVAIAKSSIPIIISTVPTVVLNEDGAPPRCTLCGRELVNMFPEDHLVKHHKDELEREAAKVVKILESEGVGVW